MPKHVFMLSLEKNPKPENRETNLPPKFKETNFFKSSACVLLFLFAIALHLWLCFSDALSLKVLLSSIHLSNGEHKIQKVEAVFPLQWSKTLSEQKCASLTKGKSEYEAGMK